MKGMLHRGIIVKIDSNISYVLADNKIIYNCYAKKTALKFTKPLVGDFVEIQVEEPTNEKAIILNFEPKKTQLDRPKIANVDQVIIITAVKKPEFASYILNKYISKLEVQHITPILIFTKIDLLKDADKDILKKIKMYEKLGYQVLKISNKEKMLMPFKKLEKMLKGKISVFVGQTGAGKSTTLNHFMDVGKQIKTQEISQALNRGKHTTTSSQLYPLFVDTLIADTPGFSAFELKNIEIEDLLYNLRIFKPYLNQCKFTDCTHIFEKGCVVKEMYKLPNAPSFIYNDYCKMVMEIKEKGSLISWKNSK